LEARESMWRVEVGYRGSYVPDAGYDPFSTNDFLPQFSLTATRTLVAENHLSFAAGLSWEEGSSSANARGDQAFLGVQRLEVPLEGRVHMGRLGYVFVRAAPGAVAEHAQLSDTAAAATLSKTRWLFATDVSGGFAFLVVPRFRSAKHTPEIWIQADGGYGWVVGERLDLAPALAANDARIMSGVDLGTLKLSGGFFRIAAAASF
jgi:hypothetical protein